jgi:hypothetical protein
MGKRGRRGLSAGPSLGPQSGTRGPGPAGPVEGVEVLAAPLRIRSACTLESDGYPISEQLVHPNKTTKLLKFVLFNNEVDVVFKLLIDKVEALDKLFKLVNIVVDVEFKLSRFNLEKFDKLFKLVFVA